MISATKDSYKLNISVPALIGRDLLIRLLHNCPNYDIDWSTYWNFNKEVRLSILIASVKNCKFPPILKDILLKEEKKPIEAFFGWISHYQGTRTWSDPTFQPYPILSRVFSKMSLEELEKTWKKLRTYGSKRAVAACCPLTLYPLVMSEESYNSREWKNVFEQRLASQVGG